MASLSEFRGFSDREITQERALNGPREVEDSGRPTRQAEFGKKTARGAQRQIFSSHPDPPAGAPRHTDAGLPNTAFFVQQSQVPTTAANLDQSEPHQINEDTRAPSIEEPSREGGKESSLEESDETMLDLTTESKLTSETNLELLQKQQKELESDNKKKKALVEQTLQQRYAKTQLEAKTLQSVREELARLDSVLSRDVTILRNRIEEATRQYSAARKRYELAEREFVSAKIALHRSSESKELLSEHLCTIIQKNEILKAEKLAGLLRTLELENEDGKTDSSLQFSSGGVLFHKTPTPGANIWPHERQGSREISARNDTGSEVTKDTKSDI